MSECYYCGEEATLFLQYGYGIEVCEDCASSCSCPNCGTIFDNLDWERYDTKRYGYVCRYCALDNEYVECWLCNSVVVDYFVDEFGDKVCQECLECNNE